MARYELDEGSLSITQFVSREVSYSTVLRALVRQSDDGKFHVRLPGHTHQPFTDLHPGQIVDQLQSRKMRVVVQGGPPCELDPDIDISHSDDDAWEFDLKRPQGPLAWSFSPWRKPWGSGIESSSKSL